MSEPGDFRSCPNCGKPLDLDARTRPNKVFCSTECRNESWIAVNRVTTLATTPDVPRGSWWNHEGTIMVGYWDLLDAYNSLKEQGNE